MAEGTYSLQLIDNLAPKLIERGIVTEDQLAIAQMSKQNMGGDVASVLIKKGYADESTLLQFLASEMSIPYVSLPNYVIDQDIVDQVPFRFIKKYCVLPLFKIEDTITMAMVDPANIFAQDEMRRTMKCEIHPVLASQKDILDTIEDLFQGPKVFAGGVDMLDVVIDNIESSDEQETKNSEDEAALEELAMGQKIIATVNNMIAQAYREKASDIHIEPTRHGSRIRFRIDGILEEIQTIPRRMHISLISRVKVMSGIDIAEKRKPQDGRVRVKIGSDTLDIRLSCYPTIYGEKIVMRLLAKEVVGSLDQLGFYEGHQELLKKLFHRSYGIFLVTGPTGSGKTTTLYAALREVNSPDVNIVSIEDPVESEVAGVNQATVNIKAGMTFPSALRSMLRQDPDIILLGEIRDGETADIAVRAALTGHMVFSTLHTNTAAGALTRLKDMGIEPYLLSGTLVGVLAQRLVRRVCQDCKEEIAVVDGNRLGEAGKQIKKSFRGKGCKNCRMSGYVGRTVIYELAPVSDQVNILVGQGATEEQFAKLFRQLGYVDIRDIGIQKINEGVTTLEEVIRVTREEV